MKQSIAMLFFYSVAALFFSGLAKKAIIPVAATGASYWFQSWADDATNVRIEPVLYDAEYANWTLDEPVSGNSAGTYIINGKIITPTALTARFSRARSSGNGNGYD